MLECFNLVSQAKDSKGKPVAMRFLWMANGFDKILMDARQQIQARKRRKEERHTKEQAAKEEAALDQQASVEEMERAKEQIRAILGRNLFRSASTPKIPESDHARRAFLLAQAKQLQQIEQFGRL